MSDYDSIEEIDINRDGAGMRIGIVAARETLELGFPQLTPSWF